MLTEVEAMFGRWYQIRIAKAELARQAYLNGKAPEPKRHSLATFLGCLIDEDHIALHETPLKKQG